MRRFFELNYLAGAVFAASALTSVFTSDFASALASALASAFASFFACFTCFTFFSAVALADFASTTGAGGATFVSAFASAFTAAAGALALAEAAGAAGVWANAVPIAKVVAMIAAITCFMIGPVLSLSLFCVVNLRKLITRPCYIVLTGFLKKLMYLFFYFPVFLYLFFSYEECSMFLSCIKKPAHINDVTPVFYLISEATKSNHYFAGVVFVVSVFASAFASALTSVFASFFMCFTCLDFFSADGTDAFVSAAALAGFASATAAAGALALAGAAGAAGVWANAVPIAKVVAMIAAITCFMIGPVLSLSLFCVVNLRKPRTQPA
ncbi:hypothetical protein [Undibacterium sp. FT79W]|uniref:hypothetical protein n=1 Tax=Undibacterium sp. FT79W TaxID=2762296 RepID=UPI001C9BB111|nr:hypothetical protein [Undibacterium sp. FT79W]